jgi:hypothetical protein
VVRPIGEEGIDQSAAERGALCISRERKGRRSDVIRRYQVGIRSSGSDVTEWWEGARAQSPRSLLQILRREGASCRELEKVSRCINCQFDLSFFFSPGTNFEFGARLARKRARFTGMSAPDLRLGLSTVHPI